MKTPPSIDTPLHEPLPKGGGASISILTTAKRLRRLQELARQLNVRRPGGCPSLGALLDAIYHGQIALRRRDDPEGRQFWLGMEEPEIVQRKLPDWHVGTAEQHRKAGALGRGPVKDPRCPDDWRD